MIRFQSKIFHFKLIMLCWQTYISQRWTSICISDSGNFHLLPCLDSRSGHRFRWVVSSWPFLSPDSNNQWDQGWTLTSHIILPASYLFPSFMATTDVHFTLIKWNTTWGKTVCGISPKLDTSSLMTAGHHTSLGNYLNMKCASSKRKLQF